MSLYEWWIYILFKIQYQEKKFYVPLSFIRGDLISAKVFLFTLSQELGFFFNIDKKSMIFAILCSLEMH